MHRSYAFFIPDTFFRMLFFRPLKRKMLHMQSIDNYDRHAHVVNCFPSFLQIIWVTFLPDIMAGGSPPPGSTH